jgi:hypothetical protein
MNSSSKIHARSRACISSSCKSRLNTSGGGGVTLGPWRSELGD